MATTTAVIHGLEQSSIFEKTEGWPFGLGLHSAGGGDACVCAAQFSFNFS